MGKNRHRLNYRKLNSVSTQTQRIRHLFCTSLHIAENILGSLSVPCDKSRSNIGFGRLFGTVSAKTAYR